jgi:predicted dehydrogenase
MIRLLIHGATEAACRHSALRLRAAAIEPCTDEAQLSAPPAACDGAVFVGPAVPEADIVAPWLMAGKHVLLATDECCSTDRREKFAAARQGGAQLAVVNPDRHLPSRQLIRRQLDRRKFGEPVFVRIHHWEPGGLPRGLGIVNPIDRSVELFGWLRRQIELVVWLLGMPPDLVYAVLLDPNDPSAAYGMYSQVQFGFPNGGMALLDYTNRFPAGDHYDSISVIASSGAIYADDHQNMQLLYRGGHPQAVQASDGSEQLTSLLQEFVNALGAGRALSASVTTWRHVDTVFEAVHRSLMSRQAVAVEGR